MPPLQREANRLCQLIFAFGASRNDNCTKAAQACHRGSGSFWHRAAALTAWQLPSKSRLYCGFQIRQKLQKRMAVQARFIHPRQRGVFDQVPHASIALPPAMFETKDLARYLSVHIRQPQPSIQRKRNPKDRNQRRNGRKEKKYNAVEQSVSTADSRIDAKPI